MRRRDLVTSLLHRARFLASHAMDLHVLTAEQERQPDVGGIPLRGAALCATYLRVAAEVMDDLAALRALDLEREMARTARRVLRAEIRDRRRKHAARRLRTRIAAEDRAKRRRRITTTATTSAA